MERLIIFGSPGVGEVVQCTPLIRRLSQEYDSTLVLSDWQEPILRFFKGRIVTFTSREAVIVRKVYNGVDSRAMHITPEFAASLGLPDTKWASPVVRNGVWTNLDNELPNKLPRFEGKANQHFPFPAKLCSYYGYDNSDLRLEVTSAQDLHIGPTYSECPTVAICNSAESIRRMPASLIRRLIDAFIGVRIFLIGFQGNYDLEYLRGDNVEFYMGNNLNRAVAEAGLMAIHQSDLVIGTDCGWGYMAIAAGKPTIILETRVPLESLLPRLYWGQVHQFVADSPSCDGACLARRLGTAMTTRPCFEWENYLIGKEVFAGKYPQKLACFKQPHAPCLDYSEKDFRRLMELISSLGLHNFSKHIKVAT